MNILRKLLIPVIIVILIRLLFQVYFFNSLEHKAQDTLFRLRGPLPVSDSIVIIAVDDYTFQDLNRQWPFDRTLHAHLIDNLKKAGARQIVFDIEFIENSSPDHDLAFLNSAIKAGNVILAGKYVDYKDTPGHRQIQSPIQPPIRNALNWGLVNMTTDWDGVVREYNLFEPLSWREYYSLGVVTLANSRMYSDDWYKGIAVVDGLLQVAGYRIPIVHKTHALVNYFGPANTFRYISYSKILDDSTTHTAGIDLNSFDEILQSRILKDKIVLIGATIDELHDKFSTPFSSDLTPGVEIHANFLEMVRTGRYLHEFNPWLILLAELILAILLISLMSWLRPQISFIIGVLLIIAILIKAYILFVHYNYLSSMAEPILLVILIYIASLVMHYLRSQREKMFIKNAFQQYLAPELVNELLKNPGSLKYGGTQQMITVLFSDIRSFTSYAEKHQPEETVQILKEYLTAMVDIIKANGGIVDKFVGDEVMALFGTPVPHKDHAYRACKAALEMMDKLSLLQKEWQISGQDGFEIGIGINTGTAVVGNLGSEQIFDYTAIGDTINLGARLENMNKEIATNSKIIISEATYNQAKDSVDAAFLQEIAIRGMEQAVRIYELKGLVPEN